jgi:ABC-type uncharacterized transport system ATPase subunit
MPALKEPLTPADAKRLLRAILAGGEVVFTSHALNEMEQDGISQADAIGVLRSGVVEPAEFERGSWRYRVRANRTYVVAAFRSELAAVVVTAWRVMG